MISRSREEKELELLNNRISILVTNGDADETMAEIKLFLEKAKLANSLKFIATAHTLKGYVYYRLSETKLAVDSFEKGLSLYSSKPHLYFNEIKQVNNSLGALYKNLGEFKSALEVLFKSIDISEQYNISNSIAYNNIATIYFKQENYKKALEYYQRAIEVENSAEDSKRGLIIKYLSNVASLHVKLGNLAEADKIYNKTYQYCEENNELSSLVQSLKGLGILYLEKSEFEEAEIFFNRAISLSQEIDFNVHLVDLLLYLAEVYEKTKRSSLQLNSLRYALEVAQESYKAKVILVNENLHDFYFQNGNISEAYNVLKTIFKLNKEKALKEKEENLLEMQEKFESEQKDKLLKQEKDFSETLKEKNQKLAELNDDLAQFNHGVSHDLKEPIRLVKGRLTYLQSIAANKLDLQEQGSLEVAQEAAERMEKMLEDLHRFSTLGGNLKDAKDIDLNEVLAIVQADLQMRIRENDAEVVIGELPVVVGFKSMYVQLFQNLINNALKFRREGVKPIVKVEYKANEEWHIIHVQDNGVGIKQDDIPLVFKLFKRLKETDYREGSGVGLSIVQKIIKKMQGEISLASVHGSGTTFIIKLPKS